MGFKFDVVFNFDVIEEISTDLTEVPRVLCVEEQKAVSTPEINKVVRRFLKQSAEIMKTLHNT